MYVIRMEVFNNKCTYDIFNTKLIYLLTICILYTNNVRIVRNL